MSTKRTSMKEDLFEALIFLKRNGNLVGVGEMFNNNYYSLCVITITILVMLYYLDFRLFRHS